MDLLTGRISAPLLLYRKFFLLRIMIWVIMYHVDNTGGYFKIGGFDMESHIPERIGKQ